jgi:hypothetical protein
MPAQARSKKAIAQKAPEKKMSKGGCAIIFYFEKKQANPNRGGV